MNQTTRKTTLRERKVCSNFLFLLPPNQALLNISTHYQRFPKELSTAIPINAEKIPYSMHVNSLRNSISFLALY
jgi:hypothetical protein